MKGVFKFLIHFGVQSQTAYVSAHSCGDAFAFLLGKFPEAVRINFQSEVSPFRDFDFTA